MENCIKCYVITETFMIFHFSGVDFHGSYGDKINDHIFTVYMYRARTHDGIFYIL